MRKMKTSVFLAIFIPVTVIVLALGIAVNLMATTFSSVFISLYSWESPTAEAVRAEGTEDWDADYYSYKTKNSDEAYANANNVVEDICDEGFVLLKNNGALPLDTGGDKIAMLGRAGADPILGGSGSGNTSNAKTIVNPYDSLKAAGFTVDDGAYNFFADNYADYEKTVITMDNYDQSQFFIGEIPTSKYTFSADSEATALVFIGRGGGEGWDLSTDLKRDAQTAAAKSKIQSNANAAAEVANYEDGQHQLELSKEEEDMVKYATENYAKTVVVINSSHAMELGRLEDNAGVDAVLWVGSPGAEGYRSLGGILSGAVNPSGRTADIYAADFTADPSFPNVGMFEYTGLSEGDVAEGTLKQSDKAWTMQYEEGIYVGYKYYETAHAEALKGNYSGFDYDSAVVYPFGYGLSYTTFEQSMALTENGDRIDVEVTVKNTGDRDGKCAVQLYYTPPYASGGIEKAEVNLIAVGKVDVPKGGSKSITLSFDKEDMASYDYKKTKTENGGYVLEKGDYVISLRSDSHTVIASDTVTVGSDVVYEGGNKRGSDEIAAVNRFDDVSTMMRDTKTEGYALNFSRADFAGTFPTAPDAATLNSSLEIARQQNGGTTIKAGLAEFDEKTDPTLGNVEGSKVYASSKPTTGEANGVQLIDLRGKDYDDPAWETLLDQVTDAEYVSATFNKSAYNTAAIESINKPSTNDPDGPAGISSLFGKTGCCAYMSEVILASTFNPSLAFAMGEALGEEAYWYGKNADSDMGGTSGWYAPGANIHRSPFGGRNFEYYSEDPVLSGKMATETYKGCMSKGVYPYIKHFALNDSEIYRTNNICIWANEQAIRELYLKPFETAIKEAEVTLKYIADDKGTVAEKTIGATAIMSSFNRLGTTWAGGHYGLMTEVLRGEWGFEGVALSDFNLYEYTDVDQAVRAGTNLNLNLVGIPFADEKSDTAVSVMREAIHAMSYAVVNSNRMQGVTPGSTFIYHLAGWQTGFIALAICLYVAAAALTVWIIVRTVRGRKRGTDDKR